MSLTLVTTGVFLAISLLIFVVGRLLIGGGRNRHADAVGSRRPLVLGPLTVAFASMVPISPSKRQKLKSELIRAGYYHRKAIEEYLGMRNAAIVAWLLFIGVALAAFAQPGDDPTVPILIGGGIVLGLIYGLPRLVLGSQARNRTSRIQHALPDALDMITMTVSGGLPMQKALEQVTGELKTTHPDLACELAIIDHQARAGSLQQALRQFAERIDVPEIVSLSALVRHSERLGGNVGTAFRDYADGIRRARRMRAEERGNKASVKLLFPVVLCLAPPIYILLLGPAALELRSFVLRENQPGGVLDPSIEAAERSPQLLQRLRGPNGERTIPEAARERE